MKQIKKLKPVEKPNIPPDIEAARLSYILETEDVFGCSFHDGELTETHIDSVNIDKTVFKNCKFTGTKLGKVFFADVVFDNCDFSAARLYDCNFFRTEFAGCKLTGTVIDKSVIMDTAFIECVGELASINESRIKSAAFSECVLKNLSLFECGIIPLILDKNNFEGLELNGTYINNSNFSNTDISGAKFPPHLIKGSEISAVQAIMIARMLGIKVL